MKKMRLLFTSLALSAVIAGVLSGCGAEAAQDSDTGAAQQVQEENGEQSGETAKIKIGVNVTVSGLSSYLDEDDQLVGSDVEILKAIDEKLTDVDFELIATSFDDVFVGLETGTYQGGIANCFLTAERIETYAIPEENIGASYIGLIVRKENADGLESLADVANVQKEKGLSFYPMQPANGLTYIVEIYNEENPDNTVEFEYTSENTNSDVLGWIPNGRYDIGLCNLASWEQNYEAEDGAYHEFLDEVVWLPLQTVGTYPLFNKEKIPEGFLEEFDTALRELKEDGTAGAISESYFGYDVFNMDIQNMAE